LPANCWAEIPTLAAGELARDRRQREYTELWRYPFVNHLAGLSEDEQRAFRDGRHPSQSHDWVEAAEPIADQFKTSPFWPFWSSGFEKNRHSRA
jgi:hypothetical protein